MEILVLVNFCSIGCQIENVAVRFTVVISKNQTLSRRMAPTDATVF